MTVHAHVHAHALLAGLLRFTVPLALLSLAYLYSYPRFHDGCSFAAPPQRSPGGGGDGDGDGDVLKLLVLADPQLEGDSSLPHPSLALSRRVGWHWRRVRRAAAEDLRRVADAISPRCHADDGGNDDCAGSHGADDGEGDDGDAQDATSAGQGTNDTDTDTASASASAWASASPSLPTTLWQFLATLLRTDVPRSLAGLRKRVDLLGNDYYLAHIYRTLHAHARPTHVAVLGDLLGSQWISDEEFSTRAARFWDRVFAGATLVPDEVMRSADGSEAEDQDQGQGTSVVQKLRDDRWARRLINVAGNHDIGYAGDITAHRLQRFEGAFGKANYDLMFGVEAETASDDSIFQADDDDDDAQRPLIHIINLNDMLLDGPPHDQHLQTQTYDYLNAMMARSPPVGSNRTFTILLTHVPLHKPAGVCTDSPYFSYFDEDDYWGRFRAGGLREQNLLSEWVSREAILQGVFGMSGDERKPAGGRGRQGLILNGHDHAGCDTVHYVRRNVSRSGEKGKGEGEGEEQAWDWAAVRHSSASSLELADTPHLREITLRSMMGEYGGNAGLLTVWYDGAGSSSSSSSSSSPGAGWKYEFSVCSLGVQHVWWAVHVVAVLAALNVLAWLASCAAAGVLVATAGDGEKPTVVRGSASLKVVAKAERTVVQTVEMEGDGAGKT